MTSIPESISAVAGAAGRSRPVAARRAESTAGGDTALQRLHAPVGLDLGGASPAETAVSVVAQIIATDRGRTAAPCAIRRGRCMPGDRIGGVLLAAGAGKRFGSDKLAAELDGVSLLQRAAAAMLGAGLDPVIVVVGPDTERPIPDGVRAVVNEHAERGMAASVRVGLSALCDAPGVMAAVVSPADQPWCGAAVYRRLVAVSRQSGEPLVVAAFDGALRNPVLLARDQWELSERIDGDVGLSAVVRGLSPLAVECGDAGSVDDVDTPADLTR